jgi:hypothetical protein
VMSTFTCLAPVRVAGRVNSVINEVISRSTN